MIVIVAQHVGSSTSAQFACADEALMFCVTVGGVRFS
jgi:hypothetical protein